MAVGAAAGAAMRWAALEAGGAVDLTLLLLNALGAGTLGALGGWAARRRHPGWVAFAGPGICGGLTTWSGLALSAAERLRAGEIAAGLLWPVLGTASGIAAAIGGFLVTSRSGSPPERAGEPGR